MLSLTRLLGQNFAFIGTAISLINAILKTLIARDKSQKDIILLGDTLISQPTSFRSFAMVTVLAVDITCLNNPKDLK